MTPSVPDWGLGRAVLGGLGPLSARQGANGPIGGGSGTRTSACTDISPTSLHDREHWEVSACARGCVASLFARGLPTVLSTAPLGLSSGLLFLDEKIQKDTQIRIALARDQEVCDRVQSTTVPLRQVLMSQGEGS